MIPPRESTREGGPQLYGPGTAEARTDPLRAELLQHAVVAVHARQVEGSPPRVVHLQQVHAPRRPSQHNAAVTPLHRLMGEVMAAGSASPPPSAAAPATIVMI
jgi:hypothetical protein